MSTKVSVAFNGKVQETESLFTPGNLVRLKEEYEDGDGLYVVMVMSNPADSRTCFSGAVITGKYHDDTFGKDYSRTSFEQFVGTITLTGSL